MKSAPAAALAGTAAIVHLASGEAGGVVTQATQADPVERARAFAEPLARCTMAAVPASAAAGADFMAP